LILKLVARMTQKALLLSLILSLVELPMSVSSLPFFNEPTFVNADQVSPCHSDDEGGIVVEPACETPQNICHMFFDCDQVRESGFFISISFEPLHNLYDDGLTTNYLPPPQRPPKGAFS
jgi:hypothetical protein